MKRFIFLVMFSLVSGGQCFAVTTSSWKYTADPKDWGSGGNTANWTNGVIPLTSDNIAIIASSNGTTYPVVNADFTLRQLQLVADGAGIVITEGELAGNTVMAFAVDSTINQVIFSGVSTINTALVTTTNTVRFYDNKQGWLPGASRLNHVRGDLSGNNPSIDLLEGSGTASVQSRTVLSYNPTATSSAFPVAKYQFPGTIDLSDSFSTWYIDNALGPFVGQLTGTNANTITRIAGDVTFQNSHTFSGTTELYGKSLTLGATLLTDGVTYASGSLPSSAVLFSETNANLTIAANATVGGLLESTEVTSPTITLGSNTLTINQGVTSVNLEGYVVGDNDFSGVIGGVGGSITKAGSETLTLSGTSTYTGATAVNAGTLNVNGSIATSSLLTIGTSGTVTGTGTLPATTNNGAIAPGNSVGTTTVSGNYIQNAAGDLSIEVSSAPAASKLDITAGTAALDGTLTLVFQRGLYPANTTLTILESTGARTGTFSSVVDSRATTFTPTYGANSVTIKNSSHHVNPHVITANIGEENANSVATYLIDDLANSTFNQDIINQVNKVLTHSFTDEQYLDALIAVSPLPVAGVNRVHAQNIERHARSVDDAFISRGANDEKLGSESVFQYTGNTQQFSQAPNEAVTQPSRAKAKIREVKFASSYGQYETSIFVDPYFIFYNQERLQGGLPDIGQVPFQVYTLGFGTGYEMIFQDNYVFEAGAGYSYSNLDWKDNFGSAEWSTLYLAPFLGWFNQSTFVNGMILGGFNFTHVLRKVPVEGISVRANGDYMSYDLLLRFNGGHRWALLRREDVTEWIQWEGTLNYLNIFTPGYKETGAEALNLKYQGNTQLILQPTLMAKWIHEVVYADAILAPVVKVGWMGTFPLNKQILKTKLALSPTNTYFNIQGYEEINQMLVGAELYYKSPRSYKLTAGFDTYFFYKSVAFDTNLKFEWLF